MNKKLFRLKDIHPPKDYFIPRDGITQSFLSNFLCCPLRGLLSVNRWSHPDKVLFTGFGSMFHDTLEKTYSLGEKPELLQVENWLELYIKNNYTKTTPKTKDDAQVDAVLAMALFTVYLDRYDKDFTEKDFRCVEKNWKAQYGKFKLRAKIDGEYFDKKNQPWLIEHKTKSQVRDEYLQKHLNFDFQCLFYILLYELVTGENIRGVLYNVIRKPGHKLHAGENLIEYRKRLIGIISAKPDDFFHRYEIAFTAQDKKRFNDELLDKIQDVHNILTGNRNVYRNEFSCLTPYKCEFLEACASGHLGGYVQREKMFPELD